MKIKALEQLNVFKIISLPQRIISIDIFRSIAIISVVFFHFNGSLPMGYLGVDLFFVISGFLIGGLLTKEYEHGKPINFFKFFLQRGFKVWPSYYVFFLVGSVLAYLFYSKIAPQEIIPFNDLKRYLFFYQNYTGGSFHWSFDHVWSLCIEEHFYILLPLIFIIVQRFFKKKEILFFLLIMLVFVGIGSKILMLVYSNSKDTYSATNNRIDALAWGVILNFITYYLGDKLKTFRYSYLVFLSGLLTFIVLIFFEIYSSNVFYHKVVFHSLTPICFALMISGVYYYDFPNLKPLRLIAYYSYNWYLWHPLFVKVILFQIGYNILGFSIYLVVSFLFAIIFTILIEETFLAKRAWVLKKLFKNY
ncbi:MAG: hypothetical protein K0S44_1008 [Bacteroidetes bacterium]|nr:hypothetical protein [Bacteroidota bacterium]